MHAAFRVLLIAAGGLVGGMLLKSGKQPSSGNQPQVAEMSGVADPRTGPSLTVLRDEPGYQSDSLLDAVMIFATHTSNPPNRLLGIDRTYTDEEILLGLKRFYTLWRVGKDDTRGVPPQVVLASQNWGCGAGLIEPQKKLSEDHGIDVYLMYPVGGDFRNREGYPFPNDKKLAEIISESKPDK